MVNGARFTEMAGCLDHGSISRAFGEWRNYVCKPQAVEPPNRTPAGYMRFAQEGQSEIRNARVPQGLKAWTAAAHTATTKSDGYLRYERPPIICVKISGLVRNQNQQVQQGS